MNAIQLEQFERFWRTYPRRIGKGAARKSFEKSLKVASFQDIMMGLQSQLPYYTNKEQQFIPHPTTWLNQERWADEPQVPQRHSQSSNGSMADFTRNMMEQMNGQSTMDDGRDASPQFALGFSSSTGRGQRH